MFNRNGVCILLGAGASYDAGLPTSKELLREFVTYLKTGEDNKNYLFQSGKPWWPAPSHADIQYMVKVIDSLRPIDIEDLMRKLKARIPSKQAVSEEAFEYSDIYESALLFIYWRLRTPSIETIAYFKHLFDFISFANGSPLVIATLNWDCCLERALGWRNISTGFEYRDQKIWTDGVFKLDRKIWIVKLHGSLSWVDYSWRTVLPQLPGGWIRFDAINEKTGTRFNRVTEVSLWTYETAWEESGKHFFRAIRSPIQWPRIIIFGPEKQKEYKLSLAMFPTLRLRFVEALEAKEILISIGFSWRDRWVCKAIREAEKTGLRVIDIRPSGQRKKAWIVPSGRIRIPSRSRDALQQSKALIFPVLRQYIKS